MYECFDGDEPEMFRYKLDTNPIFDQGMHAFINKQFEEAAKAFSEVNRHNFPDPVAGLFYEKSLNYKKQGVSDDWEGIEVMLFK